ncbi:MAG: hypothetical protein Q4G03_04555 [Planctomycetia bacterium]|nr:hypothetical protein [Planctomycetia bacterium]
MKTTTRTNRHKNAKRREYGASLLRLCLTLGVCAALLTTCACVNAQDSGNTAHIVFFSIPVAEQVAPVYASASTEAYQTGSVLRDRYVEIYFKNAQGFCAIRPPYGSFSWVNAKFVRVVDDSTGYVNSPNGKVAPARVGADSPAQSTIVQVGLRHNQKLKLLGKVSLPDGSQWYKISPPSGEFRWIKAESLVQDGALEKLPSKLTTQEEYLATVARAHDAHSSTALNAQTSNASSQANSAQSFKQRLAKLNADAMQTMQSDDVTQERLNELAKRAEVLFDSAENDDDRFLVQSIYDGIKKYEKNRLNKRASEPSQDAPRYPEERVNNGGYGSNSAQDAQSEQNQTPRAYSQEILSQLPPDARPIALHNTDGSLVWNDPNGVSALTDEQNGGRAATFNSANSGMNTALINRPYVPENSAQYPNATNPYPVATSQFPGVIDQYTGATSQFPDAVTPYSGEFYGVPQNVAPQSYVPQNGIPYGEAPQNGYYQPWPNDSFTAPNGYYPESGEGFEPYLWQGVGSPTFGATQTPRQTEGESIALAPNAMNDARQVATNKSRLGFAFSSANSPFRGRAKEARLAANDVAKTERVNPARLPSIIPPTAHAIVPPPNYAVANYNPSSRANAKLRENARQSELAQRAPKTPSPDSATTTSQTALANAPNKPEPAGQIANETLVFQAPLTGVKTHDATTTRAADLNALVNAQNLDASRQNAPVRAVSNEEPKNRTPEERHERQIGAFVPTTAQSYDHFDANGILIATPEAQDGAPKYALLAPGEDSFAVIAYLDPQKNVALDRLLGQKVGVKGSTGSVTIDGVAHKLIIVSSVYLQK